MPGGKGNIKAEDGKPFVNGDPRCNRTGRPRRLPDLDRHLIQCLGEKVNDTVALKLILIALRKSAMSGDVRAIELLLDRAYGKLKTSAGVEIDFRQLSEPQIDQIINRLCNGKTTQ